MAKEYKMSENSVAVLNFMKGKYGDLVTLEEIVGATGIAKASVNPIVNAWCKKGCMHRQPEYATEGTKAIVNYVVITDEGMAFDVEAYETAKTAADAEKAAVRAEAAKAQRAEAKAAKEAAKGE